MDLEPIYCAEQIVVPVDLADILKAYTKEVIRRQPDNLVEFSAKYFQNLANVSSSAQEAAAPSQQQLKQLHDRCGGARELSQEQIQALGAQLGISRSIVSKVLAVGRLDGGSAVEVDRFLFLLLVMSCDSFATVLLQLFDLFGRTLEAERFHLLISYLAPDMDPDVTSQFLIELRNQLADREGNSATVTYNEALELPAIKGKLG